MEGLLVIPRLVIRREISFLVDTGSDSTCLFPADGARLGIDYSTLSGRRANSIGAGGKSRPYRYRSFVAFTEENARRRSYVIDLLIYPQNPDLDVLDSILGRNVLNRWRMRYDPDKDRLAFTVVTADYTG